MHSDVNHVRVLAGDRGLEVPLAGRAGHKLDKVEAKVDNVEAKVDKVDQDQQVLINQASSWG